MLKEYGQEKRMLEEDKEPEPLVFLSEQRDILEQAVILQIVFGNMTLQQIFGHRKPIVG